MKKPRPMFVAAAVACLLLVATVVSAQQGMPATQQPMGMGTMNRPMGGNQMMAHGMVNNPMMQMSPDMQKKVMDQMIKFIRDNSKLITDVVTGRMELKELWLDDNPNSDQIVAKMHAVNVNAEQLRENMVASMIAFYNTLPDTMKKEFMMMHRRMMDQHGMGMGMMGMGMMGMGSDMMMGSGMMGSSPMGAQPSSMPNK